MCLARVQVADGEAGAKALITDVARIEMTAEGLVVTAFLGERRAIRGALKHIDFLESVALIEAEKED